MAVRPYVVLSCAMSVDGYLDDASERRLLLSNKADFDRVDAVRADCDGILVGARTVRRDDPRLIVSEDRQRERLAAGRSAQPVKITMTRSGDLPPHARFFTVGDARKLVFAPAGAVGRLAARLGATATVLDAGGGLGTVLSELTRQGIDRLLVEGGGSVHTQFLTAGLADELQLVVAPLFVGDPAAPRFVGPGRYRWDADHRMRLAETRQLGDVVLLRYLLDGDDAARG